MNIGTLLTRHARFRAGHTALIVGGERLTYAAMNAEVNRLANALLAAGVRKGEKVTTLLPNCKELMLMYWAAAKTGIVIVPSSTMLQAGGVKTLLADSDSVMVIAHPDFTEMLQEIRGGLPQVRGYILTGAANPPDGFQGYAELTAGAPDAEPPDAGLEDGDVFNIMYSSGTTGLPKGIVHTHYVRANYCQLFASSFRMTPESVVLHSGAIVFNGAMLDLMPWMFVGGTYVLLEAFDAKRVMDEIEKERVTHMVMVPSQIVAMLNHPEFDGGRLTSLEMILSVGAPLHLEHKQRLMAALPDRFYELYGLTEGFITVLDKTDALRKAGSVGCPTPFYEMKILDEAGKEVPTGEVGEICGRGPLLMPGYYKRDDLTAQAIKDGWLHSGDLGYVDDEGYLFLVDRKKDMIISGGVNVYPRDIEEIVAGHEAVAEVAVFGADDERWGEIPIAAVTPKAGCAIDPSQLLEWTNARVAAKFQRIRDVMVLDEMPRNVAGKTLKREIKAGYMAARERGAS